MGMESTQSSRARVVGYQGPGSQEGGCSNAKVPQSLSVLETIPSFPFTICGGLNEIGPHELIYLNAWNFLKGSERLGGSMSWGMGCKPMLGPELSLIMDQLLQHQALN